MSAFENFGKRGTVPDDDQMEWGICWHVYDPAQGYPVWQIAPGTSSADLPDDFRCPNCNALEVPEAR